MQKYTDVLIPKAAFARLVREVMQNDVRSEGLRIQASALGALQEAGENHITQLLQSIL
jgi:histone H3/H4